VESRECVAGGQFSLTGQSVADALEAVSKHRALPKAITVDHGTEFTSKALDEWAYQRDVQLDFIRPGKPVENAFIESFNGRLRDECLNVYEFASIARAQQASGGLATGLQSVPSPQRTRPSDPE
jgi:putative transposase